MKRATILGFVALKGGVGKTTLLASLGSQLVSLGKNVLVVDAALSSPHLALHYGLFDVHADIKDVLSGRVTVKDAVYPLEKGLSLLPCSWQSIDSHLSRHLRKHLASLRYQYDYILLDSAPVLNEEMVAVMMASDSLFVVATPDHVTLSSTLHAVRLAKQRGVPLRGLLLNKVRSRHALDVSTLEDAASVPIVALVRHSLDFKEALEKGKPLSSGKSVAELSALAAALEGVAGHASGTLSVSTINRIMMQK